MLSNNLTKYALIIFAALLTIISCSEKKEKVPVLDMNDKTQVLNAVQKHYSKDVSVSFAGEFDSTGRQFIAAGTEVENKEDWGIKFELLQLKDNEFEKIYETDVLDGSFKESLVNKIKFGSFDYELLYYNSQNYFMGSGGGEVYAYIVDFQAKQVYYAHLVVEPRKSVSLFISDNTQSKELKNFFTLNFKKDYPDLRIVEDDIIVDN